jgi:hypothetical protein
MIIGVLQIVPKEPTRAMDFLSHGLCLMVNRVAIVFGCAPDEVRAEGEERVENAEYLSQFPRVFLVRCALRKNKQLSIEHTIQSAFSVR